MRVPLKMGVADQRSPQRGALTSVALLTPVGQAFCCFLLLVGISSSPPPSLKPHALCLSVAFQCALKALCSCEAWPVPDLPPQRHTRPKPAATAPDLQASRSWPRIDMRLTGHPVHSCTKKETTESKLRVFPCGARSRFAPTSHPRSTRPVSQMRMHPVSALHWIWDILCCPR